VIELARFTEGHTDVTVCRDGEELLFFRRHIDDGRSDIEQSHLPVADFIAKGEGPWPWFDLGDRRAGAVQVLDALGVAPPPWTEPLPPDVAELFRRAYRGDTWVIELIAMGADPDPVDACGATPLWYGVRSVSAGIVVALIDAGADAGRRIELSARGTEFTTILHEIVRVGRPVALRHALARGVDPSLLDSAGDTAMHAIGADDPQIVRLLAEAGASVNAACPDGTQPIERAARKMMPATVTAMIDLGADPGRGLDAVLASWSIAGRQHHDHRSADVGNMVGLLRARGAEVHERHRAMAVGADAVEAALRR
jgi:hypothetical protein